MIVTRIVSSSGLHAKKRNALALSAALLGPIRAEVWRRYGSVAGVNRTYFDVRDEWMAAKRDFSPLQGKVWKETVHDVLDDVATYLEAAKKKARRAIYVRMETLARDKAWTKDRLEEEQKSLFLRLKHDQWMTDKYLRRMMRKYYRHGRTRVRNQIKLDDNSYNWFEDGGKGWLAVMSLEKGKRIAIPLASNYPIS